MVICVMIVWFGSVLWWWFVYVCVVMACLVILEIMFERSWCSCDVHHEFLWVFLCFDLKFWWERKENVFVRQQWLISDFLWLFFGNSAINTIYIWKVGFLLQMEKKDKIAPNGLWHKRAGLDFGPKDFLTKLINKNENYL